MLTIFRRHTKDCKFTSRKNRNCQCPIAVEGMLQGRMIRKSLDVRSWEATQKIVRDWEASPKQGGGTTVKEACEKFIDDAEFRNLSEGMIRKLKNVTKELTDRFGMYFPPARSRFLVRGIFFRVMMGRHLPQVYREASCTTWRKCLWYGSMKRRMPEIMAIFEEKRGATNG